MEIAPHINVDPAICGGTPVITGTRVHVAIVVGSLAGEMTMKEVMDAYEVTQDQIKGALAYAAGLILNEDPKILNQSHLVQDWWTEVEDEAWQYL
jgi:uncharacterized protein (DUF433 family)